MNPHKIKRIVVRAPTWVGDAVMSLPALHELRRIFPEAYIAVAAPPGSADIFIDSDSVNEVIVQSRSGLLSQFRQAGEWRKRHFDLAVIFQNSFGSAAVASRGRVPIRIGYATDRRSFLLTHPLPVPEWKNQKHESFYYLNIVAELERMLLGTSTVNEIEPQFALQVSEERKERARQLLAEHLANLAKPIALLCPGSINSRAKRWPPERYAALADRLARAGMTVALIGSPGELPVSEEVAAHAESSPLILTGKTTVAEAVALISIADVLITNDTGPAHIGATLKTRTIVIFGPTNPLTTYPMSPNAEIIRHPPDCAPCMLRDCPIDHRCMTAISPEEVFERTIAHVGIQPVG
ncbi:MAG TPA: lipopolysaccharide heptosyltransferase II [Pyrinomonadaceae bacterium]|nr:lipopolysaccharide heptosyltransferase II [Pyrinomonadaceae bacterium]